MSKPTVEILQGEKRFAVISKYDKALVANFKTIDKRHYNAEKHEWTRPIQKLEEFMTFLDQGKFTYTKTSTKNQAKIEVSAKNLELSSNSFIEDFNAFKQIYGALYDRQISKWTFPLNKQADLEELLQKYKFSFIIQFKEEVKEEEKLTLEASAGKLQALDNSETTDEEITPLEPSQGPSNEKQGVKRTQKKQLGKLAKKLNL